MQSQVVLAFLKHSMCHVVSFSPQLYKVDRVKGPRPLTVTCFVFGTWISFCIDYWLDMPSRRSCVHTVCPECAVQGEIAIPTVTSHLPYIDCARWAMNNSVVLDTCFV